MVYLSASRILPHYSCSCLHKAGDRPSQFFPSITGNSSAWHSASLGPACGILAASAPTRLPPRTGSCYGHCPIGWALPHTPLSQDYPTHPDHHSSLRTGPRGNVHVSTEHFCSFCNTDVVLHSRVINCSFPLPTLSYLWVGEPTPFLTQHNEGWLKWGAGQQ